MLVKIGACSFADQADQPFGEHNTGPAKLDGGYVVSPVHEVRVTLRYSRSLSRADSV
jgi:hypothetical protein